MALNAKLHISTAFRNEKTILKDSFCTPPFKIADITEDHRQKALHLMLMSSSPGVLDGDDYSIEIDVADECSLQVQTQSYQRLFHMKKGASQNMVVRLEKGSSFTYLPHPVVPHEESKFSAKNKIYLADNCRLIWGEILNCGRSLNKEVFLFTSYHNLTEIFLRDKMVVKENLLLKPNELNVNGIGQLEGYTHQATFIYIDEKANPEALISSLLEECKPEKNIAFGISSLPVKGVIVRLLGYKAEQLFAIIKKLALSVDNRKYNPSLNKAAHVI